jgi:hypothetical protein
MVRQKYNQFGISVEVKKICNIYENICELHIPEGYHLCYACKGVGCCLSKTHFKQKYITIVRCEVCKGSGIVDWISNARKNMDLALLNFLYVNFSIYCPRDKRCKRRKRWAQNKEREAMI